MTKPVYAEDRSC